MLLAFRIHIPNIRICKYWSLHIHETSLKFWSCSISLHISTLNSLTQPINNIPPYFPFHQEIFRFDSVEIRFSLLDRALIYYFDIYIFLLLARPGARQLHTHMPVWACYTHTRQIICGFTHTHAVCDTCVENGAFGAAMIGRRHGNHRGLLANHSTSGAANTHRRASAINTSCHACCSCVCGAHPSGRLMCEGAHICVRLYWVMEQRIYRRGMWIMFIRVSVGLSDELRWIWRVFCGDVPIVLRCADVNSEIKGHVDLFAYFDGLVLRFIKNRSIFHKDFELYFVRHLPVILHYLCD